MLHLPSEKNNFVAIMKNFLSLCLLTLCSCSLFAQSEEVYCLAVAYALSDEVDFFAFDANPTVTFGEGTLSVTQDGEDAYKIEDMLITDVREWYFCDAVPGQGTDGIAAVSADGSQMSFSAGQALMTGLKAGAHVYLYTADGKTIGSVTATADGRAVVDFNSLKGGQVYILRTPSASYKIVK